jgi:CRP/FNR family cyclic AMP-dependent transcriptional regulator
MTSRTTDELLSRVPLFSDLSKKDLREISNLTTRLELPAGHELMHQGGLGREFVIVLEGTVDVVIDGAVVAQCGAGDFFGEIALLEGQPRNASVVARDDVVVDVIGRGEFSSLLDDRPEIEKKVRAAMAQRLADDAKLQGGADSSNP